MCEQGYDRRLPEAEVAVGEPTSGLVTLLFTDLVGSTELLARAGDEDAQKILSSHHHLLNDVVAEHGGHEVKWLGDGLMVAFPSAADALSCAIAMQQAARRPVGGVDLQIRVGLTAGEALRDATDYFGTPVVTAKRLCDRAAAGQILCSDIVAGLLAGRPGFVFASVGELELKGLPAPVPTYEVTYEAELYSPFSAEFPMVGREAELARLTERLRSAVNGRGGLVLLAGEPGIGKTRLAEEVAARAERDGAYVLWGRCFEGDWAPPYAPFAEALAPHVAVAAPDELRADIGPGGGSLAQLVPKIRDVLPDLATPPPVPPEEERFRLLDAMAGFLVARSRRAPVLLVLDDLQWADRSTVALVRHLVRFAPRERILILGAYPDADLDRSHPLSELLGVMAREAGYDQLHLRGLEPAEVTQLLGALGGHAVEENVGAAWVRQTEGNPFFIMELLRHLIEEGTLFQGPDGRWTTTKPLLELGIPERIREVVARRLARLSKAANQLLQAGAAFDGTFRFAVAARMADLPEMEALDALDEALASRLLVSAGSDETYAFVRTLIRQTVYAEFSPSRQIRLHRRAAEALESVAGDDGWATRAGEIAVQYHRSRPLGNAERGVEPALAAADLAQAAGGHDEAASLLRLALDLVPSGDERRPRLLGRLGIVLAWALDFDGAVRVASEAGDAIAEAETKQAAAEYLSDAAYVCVTAGSPTHAWDLAGVGLTYAGERNVAWARLVSLDSERAAAEDPNHPGIPIDSVERRESARILREAHLDPLGPGPMEGIFDSRAEALESSNLIVLTYWCGEVARCLPRAEAETEEARVAGRLARAARGQSLVSVCHSVLGSLEAAKAALAGALALADRLGRPVPFVINGREQLALALNEGWDELAAMTAPLRQARPPALAWAQPWFDSFVARAAARGGDTDEAMACVDRLVQYLQRAPAWALGVPLMADAPVEVLWLLERADHADAIERALREKVVGPDFRFPGMEGRLGLARLCALTGRHEEAAEWFAEARVVLKEQGARPLLAVADHDEALMYARRGGPGDVERARPLLSHARDQFESLGMTGWIRRAAELSGVLH
jgi:class 3 adenylate cyclase/tetratricopeptide (TPR) repeat protein